MGGHFKVNMENNKTKLQEEYDVLIKEGRLLDYSMVFVILKRMLKPVKKWPAFSLGLIDEKGKVIKKPETSKEKDALTLLDRFILKLKGMLTLKNVALFSSFLILKEDNSESLEIDVITERVNKRRLAKDVYDRFEVDIKENFEDEDDFWNTILETKL